MRKILSAVFEGLSTVNNTSGLVSNDKYVYQISPLIEKGKVKEEEIKMETQIHFIHIIDRSGSMHYDLPKLIDNVKHTLNCMKDNDLISVIWFASEHQCEVLLKGASKNQHGIKELIDTLRTSMGCTCFSRPLQEADKVINDLKVLCPNFAVTLFTDGCPVVPWSYKEEVERIEKMVAKIAPNVISMSTIGYGNYYDKELLEKMTANLGKYFHSSEIDDYSEIFAHNYKVAKGCSLENTKIEFVSIFDNDYEILYITENDSKLVRNQELNLNSLSKRKNLAFLITNKPLETGDSILVNDEVVYKEGIELPKFGKITKATLPALALTMAYEYMYAGRNDEAIDVLISFAKQSDKPNIAKAVRKVINAFTMSEKQDTINYLRKIAFNSTFRNREFAIEDGVTFDINNIQNQLTANFCVMDLLNILAQDKDAFYYPVTDEYQRIGMKTNESFSLFKSTSKANLAPFSGIELNSNLMNVNITYSIDGEVALNPNSAKSVGLPTIINSRIYRKNTIIKDGNMHIKKFRITLNKDTLNLLMEKQDELVTSGFDKFLFNIETLTESTYMADIKFDSDNTLPIATRKFATQVDTKDVYNAVKELNILKAQQKVLNNEIKETRSKSSVGMKVDQYQAYTSDQIKVLKEHGLDSKLNYSGIGRTTEKVDENTDSYDVRVMSFDLAGWSSLPSVADVLKRVANNKALNAPATAMFNELESIKMFDSITSHIERARILEERLNDVKAKILDLSFFLSTTRMAKIITGSWFSDLTVEGEKFVYIDEATSDKLIIKNTTETKYFS